MKKQMVLLMLMLCTALGVFAQQGVIKELNGTVELKPAGASVFIAAKQGDTIARDTVVSTGFKSTAVITVGSATLTVRPLTRLSLAEITQAQGNELVNVNLQAGRVRAGVRPPTGTRTEFTVRSPSATASVRGTEFEFDTMTLAVINGTVAYSGAKGSTMLIGQGGTSHVDPITLRVADPIETGAESLLPPPPVGANEHVNTQSGSVSEVDFSMELKFQ
jgi:hypothetical protein